MDLMPSAHPVVTKQSADLDLFLAIQSQQINALDLLYDRYGRLVYSTAAKILNNIEEAEEVTQETFLRLWQRSEIYQPNRGSLSGFLITLARSRSLDLLRSRSASQKRLQRVQSSTDCVSSHNPPLEFATTAERTHRVREALNQLPDADRALLETAYYEGLSQSEIADRHGLPLGTVKSRSRQALKKLHAVLKHLI
jgi:RNA polymerase sigma-70 factor, ECF subfamily